MQKESEDPSNSRQPHFAAVEGASAYGLWQHQMKRTELRKEHIDYWENTAARTGTGRPVDAIICPTAPSVAPPHGKTAYALRWCNMGPSLMCVPFPGILAIRVRGTCWTTPHSRSQSPPWIRE